MTTAVLLIAHGSRRAAANDDLVEVAARLLKRGEFEIVVASYLELAEPSIPDGAEQCISAGADSIRLLPYFLSAGSHVMRDLQRYRDELRERFPQHTFTLCPPLGLHPLMLDIVQDRLSEEL